MNKAIRLTKSFTALLLTAICSDCKCGRAKKYGRLKIGKV